MEDGTTYSVAENTITVDVTAVNDAPTAADKTVTVNEDTDYVFATIDFGFSDVDAGDVLTAVKVTTLPVSGTLKLSGVDVTLNQVIVVADIVAGNLKFKGASNASGAAYATIGFNVEDGTTYSVAENTITVDVTAVNDAPTAADKTVTVNEDTDYVFAAIDFGFSDVDAGDVLTAVKVTTLPVSGTLKLSGVDVTLNQVIVVADIIAGNLKFKGASNASGAGYATIGFNVEDGTTYSVAENTITVDVTAVNDAPTAADKTVTVNEDTDYVFAAIDFGFSDVDAGDVLTAVKVTTLPVSGTLKLSGVDVTLNQVIAVGDIVAGNLKFKGASNASGAAYATIGFTVEDGTTYSVAENTITVDVTAVNDAPTAADKTVTVNEDTDYVFAAIDFGFSDVDAGDVLTAVKVTTLPVSGTLKLSGVDVTLNQVIVVADIVAGNLKFKGASDASGAAYATIGFTVEDGTTYSVAENTITVDVTAVNDAPTAADKTVTVNEDTDYVFAAIDFGFSDVDAGDVLTAVKVTTLPVSGTLKLSGVDVILNQVIAVADITAGNLKFKGASNASGAGYATIGFTVEDGTTYSVAENTITVDVTAVNDAPTAADKTVTVNEDTDYVFATIDFGFSDVDAGDVLTAVKVTTLPVSGTLKLSGVDVTLNQVIVVADIEQET